MSAGASIPSYIEVSVLCLYGDILPSDSKAMDWCKGIFWQIHNSQIFYALNFILLFIGAVYMLDKHFLFCLLIFLNWGKFFSGSKNSTASNADGFVADCYRLDELQNVGWV